MNIIKKLKSFNLSSKQKTTIKEIVDNSTSRFFFIEPDKQWLYFIINNKLVCKAPYIYVSGDYPARLHYSKVLFNIIKNLNMDYITGYYEDSYLMLGELVYSAGDSLCQYEHFKIISFNNENTIIIGNK